MKKELPVRKRLRLKGYDYSSAGYYFITICVESGHEILGSVRDAHSVVPCIELTEIGKIVIRYIENIPKHYGNVSIDKYVVMPNHIHMVVILERGTPGCASPTKSTLAKVINAFKSLTSRQFGESMWQRGYYDHIIRSETDYQRIWQYINENPVKWVEDRYYGGILNGKPI